MAPLDELRAEDFDSQVATAFVVVGSGVDLSLDLVEVTRHGVHEGAPRPEPFSLLFTGPRAPALGQGMVALDHAALGRLEIFLVPVGEDRDVRRYEAVFG